MIPGVCGGFASVMVVERAAKKAEPMTKPTITQEAGDALADEIERDPALKFDYKRWARRELKEGGQYDDAPSLRLITRLQAEIAAKDQQIAILDEGRIIERSAADREIGRLNERIAELEARHSNATNLLSELTSIVRGECPALLNEYSGGDGELSCKITDALNAALGSAKREVTAEMIRSALNERALLGNGTRNFDEAVAASINEKLLKSDSGSVTTNQNLSAKTVLIFQQADAFEPNCPNSIVTSDVMFVMDDKPTVCLGSYAGGEALHEWIGAGTQPKRVDRAKVEIEQAKFEDFIMQFPITDDGWNAKSQHGEYLSSKTRAEFRGWLVRAYISEAKKCV